MKKVIAFAAAMAFAAPAFAGECPANMAAIDEALQTASLDAAQMDEVTALRASGEEKHNAGDHAGSMEDLAKAKEILGVE